MRRARERVARDYLERLGGIGETRASAGPAGPDPLVAPLPDPAATRTSPDRPQPVHGRAEERGRRLLGPLAAAASPSLTTRRPSAGGRPTSRWRRRYGPALVSLPIFPGMRDHEIATVCGVVSDLCRRYGRLPAGHGKTAPEESNRAVTVSPAEVRREAHPGLPRSVEIVLSATGLVAVLPLLAVAAAAIRLTSPGSCALPAGARRPPRPTVSSVEAQNHESGGWTASDRLWRPSSDGSRPAPPKNEAR